MANFEERILAEVERNFDKQVDFLEQLIRYPTLRNKEGSAQDFIQSALTERGYFVNRFQTDASLVGIHPAFSPATVDYADSWNVIGNRKAAAPSGRSLAFNSHMDVVPAGPVERWASPPFEPRRDGDWLYGRGAGDMKAGLAASIFALDAIEAAGLTLQGDVQVQSVVEEEITGNGAATALALGFTADAIISAEPTAERLVRANAGVFKFRLVTRGRSAHPRQAALGKSAIKMMMVLIERLHDLERKWINEIRQEPYFGDIENPVSLTIGTISGGEWIASLPSECAVEGRIGIHPNDRKEDRIAEFEHFIKQVSLSDPAFGEENSISLTWVGNLNDGYILPEGSEAEDCLRTVHKLVHEGGELPESVVTAYLDAAVFSVHGGITSLVYGPISQNHHGIDERVNLASLRRVTKTLALFAANWCGVKEAE